MFQPWTAELPDSIELCAVELPGRGTRLRERPLTSVHAAVGELTDAIAAELDRPYALFGHSLGALVAFEVAQELRRRGAPPPLLLTASARRAPHLAKRTRLAHMLDDAGLADHLRELNGTPEEILGNAELMALVLPAVRADLAADETYAFVVAPPLDIPIHVHGGTSDDTVPIEDLTAWGLHTHGVCEVSIFPGDHFFINTARREVIDRLVAALAAAGAESHP